MDDVILPAFYVVSRDLPVERAPRVALALSMTPVDVAIISDVADTALARELGNVLLMVDTSEQALQTALELSANCLPLVIGTADLLDAVYADGRREAVAVAS